MDPGEYRNDPTHNMYTPTNHLYALNQTSGSRSVDPNALAINSSSIVPTWTVHSPYSLPYGAQVPVVAPMAQPYSHGVHPDSFYGADPTPVFPQPPIPQPSNSRPMRPDPIPPVQTRPASLQTSLAEISSSTWLQNDEPEPIVGGQSILCRFLGRDPALPGLYICLFDDCNKTFDRLDRAIPHIRVHLGHKPVPCNGQCGKPYW
ncbi:SubName: Full=Uncharacterized protein {ECO:0000313/EMBL:CCA72295.1} [Serendipita indica DSM 11827]|uniref:C2H2-type domain-containing protein n=1 Tax=Serendipita indica (strain DSM 11827) TaxID=1109443 RepID=G4TLV2_SERID|nr:SubName: Full=Uncharacterized protein {ECO:0000313/EMBL:CCA72295.1} [Serendipita indica DSM 11827]CCA72295.1 hypothetical protein PIIN_06229 [Serendipita indica DSM 11827]